MTLVGEACAVSVHASSMVESTAERDVTTTLPSTVTPMFVVTEQRRCDAAGPSLSATDQPIVDGRTQWMPTECGGRVNSRLTRLVCGAQRGLGCMLWSAAARNIGFPPPAQR